MTSDNGLEAFLHSFNKRQDFDTLPPIRAKFQDFHYPYAQQEYNTPYTSTSTAPALPSFTPPPPPPFNAPSPVPMWHSPFQSHSYASTSTSTYHHHSLPPAEEEEPSLFDDTESALFSSFLTTLEVDQNFLFNPVLPPGLPSPPPEFLHQHEVMERDNLGLDFGEISLKGANASNESLNAEAEASGSKRGRRMNNRTIVAEALNGREKKSRIDFDRDFEEEEEDQEEDSRAAPPPPPTRRRASRTSLPKPNPPTSRRLSAALLRSNESFASTSVNSRPSPRPDQKPLASLHWSPARSSSSPPDAERDDDSPPADNSLDRKTPLSETEKRANHIKSEQRRRNAIRLGFKDLVDLLTAGEATSGIVVAPPEAEPEDGKKKKTKGSGRGRGRKAEVGAGASKSVVLEKATTYIRWLERGNQGLAEELARVEGHISRGM